FWA
ncbi:DEAD/DEAH box helicase family protein, partial [Vibrio parahaemolyticus VPTS-2010]